MFIGCGAISADNVFVLVKIAAGKDINYEGASGNVDFDKNGDVGGIYGVNTVGDDGNWSNELLK